MTLVNALTDLVSAEGAGQFAADLGVYIGALAMIVAAAFGIAELVGLIDYWRMERTIRRNRMLRFKGYGAVASISRRPGKPFGKLERKENGHG